jgi:hypothetical protein
LALSFGTFLAAYGFTYFYFYCSPDKHKNKTMLHI